MHVHTLYFYSIPNLFPEHFPCCGNSLGIGRSRDPKIPRFRGYFKLTEIIEVAALLSILLIVNPLQKELREHFNE